MLTALDEGIGNITDTLKSTGVYENSVMVVICIKIDEFVSKMMDFALKMMNVVLKMMI